MTASSDYDAIDVFVADLNAQLRGKRYPGAALPGLLTNGARLIGSIFALDVLGENVDAAGLAQATGDPDRVILPATGRVLPSPWLPGRIGALHMTMVDEAGRPFFADPRAVLARVAGRLEALGLTIVVAAELEFHLIDRARDTAGGPLPPSHPLTGGRHLGTDTNLIADLEGHSGLLMAMAEACTAQGAATTTMMSEYGPGQFEINLAHGTDPLAAADHAVLMRRAVRGVARAGGFDATFMAKPYPERAGNGLHFHVSLLESGGRPLFLADAPLGHAIGGLMATLAESTALLAPGANSFRRLRRDSYAPVQPSWGFDNRTVALRVVGEGVDRRVEHRVAGADANPYLALAAVLAGIHHGLTGRIDPGPPIRGNAYASGAAPLPTTWVAALDRFEAGAVLGGYLGERYKALYLACKRQELARFEALADIREYSTYLDRF